MKDVIEAIDKEVIKQELKRVRYIRRTNNGDNEIYFFTHFESPILMQEIGRLRELTFRFAGGGTGKESDVDSYDLGEKPYQQLVVWDPEKEEFLGGYRFILGNEVEFDQQGVPLIATSGLLNFTPTFINEYLPVTIELGRSFVQPHYQVRSAGRKALYALDNLWDGLGALIVEYPNMKYFFGKVTMYTHYNRLARDYMLYFLKSQFPDRVGLMSPKEPLPFETDVEHLKTLFLSDDYKENYKELSAKVRALGELIPPLINSYMSITSTMMSFGTAMNYSFGNVEETGLLITIPDIFESKKERHIDTYLNELKSRNQ